MGYTFEGIACKSIPIDDNWTLYASESRMKGRVKMTVLINKWCPNRLHYNHYRGPSCLCGVHPMPKSIVQKALLLGW